MDRILKIYEMLTKDDMVNLLVIIPELKTHLIFVEELEIYKFIDNDTTFTFDIIQIDKLSIDYEVTITNKYLVINK